MLKMFSRTPQTCCTVVAILLASLRAAHAADGSVRVRIDASQPSAPVTIEPIGTLMARSLWAGGHDDVR